VLDGDTAPLPKKGTEAPLKFSARFYCGRTAGCIKMPFGMEVALSAGDFVLDGDQPIPPKKGANPQFSAHFYSGQTAGWIKMPLGMEVHGDQPPHPKNGAERPSQFSAHVYCGQTAGWMKVALGMQVGLGPGHTVLDGDPAPLPKRGQTSPQIFGPFLLWPNDWMDQDATWHVGRPQPRRLCVRWGSSPLPQNGAEPPIFGQCLLWPNGWMD